MYRPRVLTVLVKDTPSRTVFADAAADALITCRSPSALLVDIPLPNSGNVS